MMSRRAFNRSLVAILPVSAAASGFVGTENRMSYDRMVEHTYRHTNNIGDAQVNAYQELVRYATMAANRHNSQPWKFSQGKQSIIIAPDFTRRCPIVDPSDHHVLAMATPRLEH